MAKELKIIFSRHARYQLNERKIPIKEVRNCLNNPDKTSKQSSNRFRALKKFKISQKDYLLIVIYDKISSKVEVVTVFITSKIKKYL